MQEPFLYSYLSVNSSSSLNLSIPPSHPEFSLISNFCCQPPFDYLYLSDPINYRGIEVWTNWVASALSRTRSPSHLTQNVHWVGDTWTRLEWLIVSGGREGTLLCGHAHVCLPSATAGNYKYDTSTITLRRQYLQQEDEVHHLLPCLCKSERILSYTVYFFRGAPGRIAGSTLDVLSLRFTAYTTSYTTTIRLHPFVNFVFTQRTLRTQYTTQSSTPAPTEKKLRIGSVWPRISSGGFTRTCSIFRESMEARGLVLESIYQRC